MQHTSFNQYDTNTQKTMGHCQWKLRLQIPTKLHVSEHMTWRRLNYVTLHLITLI